MIRLSRSVVGLGATAAALLAACSSGASFEEELARTDLAETGSACVTRQELDQELCFLYTDGQVSVSARGLQDGSTLTVRGAGGSSVDFDIAAGESIQADLGGEILDSPFTATGTWSDGETASLTVEPAAG